MKPSKLNYGVDYLEGHKILLSYSQYLEEDARHPAFLEQQRCGRLPLRHGGNGARGILAMGNSEGQETISRHLYRRKCTIRIFIGITFILANLTISTIKWDSTTRCVPLSAEQSRLQRFLTAGNQQKTSSSTCSISSKIMMNSASLPTSLHPTQKPAFPE